MKREKHDKKKRKHFVFGWAGRHGEKKKEKKAKEGKENLTGCGVLHEKAGRAG